MSQATVLRPIMPPRWPGAHRLRQIRQARGWTVGDLARAAGVTGAAVYAWERGVRGPSAGSLLSLAGALGVAPDALWPTATTYLGEMAASLGSGGRETWSVSKLTAYLMCPARYYFQYVVGQSDEQPHSPESALGHAVHSGIERLHRSRLGEPGPTVADATRRALAKDLAYVVSDPGAGEPPDAIALAAEAETLVTLYAGEIAPQFEPALVEQRTEVVVGGVPFTAVLDVITSDGWVRDTKTARRRPSENDITGSLQATVYTLAYQSLAGEPSQGVAFDYLIRNKTPVAQTYATARGRPDFDRLARIVEGVTEAATRGRYYPNPQSKFGCAGCPFRAQCHDTF